MLSQDYVLKVLVVDDDEFILDVSSLIIGECFNYKYIITRARSGEQAIKILNSEDIDLCICDHYMANGNGVIVNDFIVRSQLKSKFILCSSLSMIDSRLVYNMNEIYFNIYKTNLYQGIELLCKKVKDDYTQLHFSKDSTKKISISIDLLKDLTYLPSDLYVELSEEKAVRCFKKGDFFTAYDHIKYCDKGIRNLFFVVERKEHIVYDYLLSSIKILLIKKIDNKKTEELFKKLQEQVSFLFKNYGVTDELLDISIESVSKIIDELYLDKVYSKKFRKIVLRGDFSAQYFSFITILIGILSKRVYWITGQVLKKLLLASFFNSIFVEHIDSFKVINFDMFKAINEKLTSTDREKFINYPFYCKENLSRLSSEMDEISKILLEQHEMPNGEGGPRGLDNKSISMISAAFILISLFTKKILLMNTTDYLYEVEADLNEFIEYLKDTSYNKGNFKGVFIELEKIFKK